MFRQILVIGTSRTVLQYSITRKINSVNLLRSRCYSQRPRFALSLSVAYEFATIGVQCQIANEPQGMCLELGESVCRGITCNLWYCTGKRRRMPKCQIRARIFMSMLKKPGFRNGQVPQRMPSNTT